MVGQALANHLTTLFPARSVKSELLPSIRLTMPLGTDFKLWRLNAAGFCHKEVL